MRCLFIFPGAICLIILLLCCDNTRKLQPHITGFIPVADSKIYYETTGQGPALVLLHGALMDRRMWEQQVAEFAKDHLVITCDQRGHGLTIDGDSSYFMHTAVRMLLDSLHVQRATIVGHSMGAIAATDFAIDYPAYTEKLILITPGLSGNEHILPEDSTMVRYFQRMDTALLQRDTLLAAEYFIRNWYDGPLRRPAETDTLQRRKAVKMAYRKLQVHQMRYWPQAAKPASIERLNQITCPTLIMVTDKDNPAIRRNAGVLKKTIVGSRQVIIYGTAHLPGMERAGEINGIVRVFLKEN